MGRRDARKITRRIKAGGQISEAGSQKEKGPRLIASGRISAEGRETYVTFESMSEIGQAAVRRVFGDNVRRAEEIANA